jgi:hypothetical protein
MSKAIRIIRYLILLILVVVFTGCASNKNTFYQKRKKSTQVSNTQLGRNKYYFSPNYQKKLKASYRKK